MMRKTEGRAQGSANALTFEPTAVGSQHFHEVQYAQEFRQYEGACYFDFTGSD